MEVYYNSYVHSHTLIMNRNLSKNCDIIILDNSWGRKSRDRDKWMLALKAKNPIC